MSATEVDREEVVAHVLETGCTSTEAAERYGVSAGTIRMWLSRHRRAQRATEGGNAKAKRAKKGGKKKTGRPPRNDATRARSPSQHLVPAAELPEDVRAELVDQLRRDLAVRRAIQSRLLLAMEDDSDIDPRSQMQLAQAASTLTRSIGDLVRSAPGLMAEVDRVREGERGGEDERASRIAELYLVDLEGERGAEAEAAEHDEQEAS